MEVELRHLRVFLAVAEEPIITRAAARLHITLPALSRTLRRLEQEVGGVLVERTTRARRSTGTGEAFYDRCQAVLAAVDDTLACSELVRAWGSRPGCCVTPRSPVRAFAEGGTARLLQR